MKNMIRKTTLILFLAVFLVPSTVFAATSATIYVSPSSSSVTNGNNVTISIRINPNSNPVDSVQAVLNFDSSKLQYLSYSAGAFTTFQANASGSSFSYVGTLLGSSTSSDSLMFSVTFKAVADGSASLSVSGVSAAYQGNAFNQTLAANGSVTVSTPAPPVPTVTPPKSTVKTPTTSTSTQVEVDTTAPTLVGDPSIVVSKNSISVSLKTSENAKLSTRYSLGEATYSLNGSEFKTDHSFIIGQDAPLVAGSIYQVEIDAEDQSGNKATIYSKEIRTTGVDYRVRITDVEGVALSNHKVQLFSEPQETTTDGDGIATFADVTPGEHVLVFEIDGLVLRRTVTIGSDIELLNSNNDSYEKVTLPVRFQENDSNKVAETNNTRNYLIIAGLAAMLGVITTSVFFLLKEKGIFRRGARRDVKPKPY